MEALTRHSQITLLGALFCSTVVGLFLGYVNTTWSGVLELAQYRSGVVEYPTINLWLKNDAAQYSIWLELCTFILKLGGTERQAAMMLSSLQGGLAFLSITMLALAFTRDVLVALFAPLVFILIIGSSLHAPLYPIHLYGTYHTAGSLGLTCVLFSVALLFNNYQNTAAFLAGLCLLSHFTLGVFLILLFVAVMVFRSYIAGKVERETWVFLAGLLLGISISVVLLFLNNAIPSLQGPPLSREMIDIYFHYIFIWDAHRGIYDPLTMFNLRVLLALGIALGCIGFTRFLAHDKNNSVKYVLAIGTIAGVIGLLIVFLPHEFVPLIVYQSMPGRFIDVPIVIALVFIISYCLSRNRAPVIATGMIAFMIVMWNSQVMHLFFYNHVWIVIELNHWINETTGYWLPFNVGYESPTYFVMLGTYVFLIGTVRAIVWHRMIIERWLFSCGFVGVLLVGLFYVGGGTIQNTIVAWLIGGGVITAGLALFTLDTWQVTWVKGSQRSQAAEHVRTAPVWASNRGPIFFILTTIVYLIVVAVTFSGSSGRTPNKLQDWSNNKFFHTVSKDKGYLFTNSMFGGHLQSRRPMVTTPVIPVGYAPRLALEYRTLHSDVYGVDFVMDEPVIRHKTSSISTKAIKRNWESWSETAWQSKAEKYDSWFVLCKDVVPWALNLPVVARTLIDKSHYIYYKIPQPI